MTILILGLILFLGTHSIRIFANDFANRQIEERGPLLWKISYAVLSIIGFVCIIQGYSIAQETRQQIWLPPRWTGHVTALLTLFSFILFVSTNRPKNLIYAKVKHPMVIAVKVWALSHLIANGSLAAIVLFGSFLVWAVLDFRSCRSRDRLKLDPSSPPSYAAIQVSPVQATFLGTLPAILIGTLLWGVFAFYLHRVLIDVQPFMKSVQ